jgi:chaperone required for assembly of F1-ATPase
MGGPAGGGSGPLEAARRLAAQPLRRRFYKGAAIGAAPDYPLLLDGKPVKTPAGNPLAVPRPAIAAAIAAEWAAQGETIDPASMPLTRLVNSAIDGVAGEMPAVRATILTYAGADLLCYRAERPEVLAAAQRVAWDPVLAWAERHLGVRFALSAGVVHVAQPNETLAAVARELATIDAPLTLAALNLATTLAGSALLALALARGALSEEAAWDAAHVDEDWNVREWGADAEAMRARALRRADFAAAALVLAAMRT